MPDAKSDAVMIAYVCGNTVHYSWHRCLMDLISYDVAHGGSVVQGGFVGIRCGTDGLADARNKAVEEFLASDAEWLWWVDTDMGFGPDTVERLLEAADRVERPIVGGLCFFNREDAPDGMGGYKTTVVPTVYDWSNTNGQMGWAVRWRYEPNAVVRCGATGSACILIHRSVFDRLEAEHGPGWYTRTFNPTTGQLMGEDMSFCLRAGALNIPVHVHTGVPTTHVKPMWVGEEHYWTQVALDSINQQLAADASSVPATP